MAVLVLTSSTDSSSPSIFMMLAVTPITKGTTTIPLLVSQYSGRRSSNLNVFKNSVHIPCILMRHPYLIGDYRHVTRSS